MLLPYYHIVSDEWVPHVSPLYGFRNIREFGKNLDWLLSHADPLSLKDFLAVTASGLPAPRHSFFLTFDDGFREIFDVVRPILRAKGVPAVFFVTSGTVDNKFLCLHQKIALILDVLARKSVELARKVGDFLSSHGVRGMEALDAIRSLEYSQDNLVNDVAGICEIDLSDYLRSAKPYLTSDQISILLADGFGIGSHSIDHPRYSGISFDEQVRQTADSMNDLAGRFALPYRLFAFPHSDAGVSMRFFENIFSTQTVQATFGTSAPHVDCVPRSFQRFSMEKTRLSAASIVALQTARRFKQRLTGGTLIKRP
jgi:peptidoglycan/xylan/chitin deacetylase (PgdA/CDA1 family)